jgi:hypothetical protein
MLRTQVAPVLRQMGFRGSGGRFHLPNERGDHALVGFQKHSSDGGQVCQLTVNVSFNTHDAWEQFRAQEPELSAKPTAQDEAPGGWQERVGYLLDPPHDHWWTIRSEEDVEAVADHVTAILRSAVVPQLMARLAQIQPPDVPSEETAPTLDCPWPFCTDGQNLYLEDVDPDRVDNWDSPMTLAEQQSLVLARRAVFSREDARDLLQLSARRLNRYADRLTGEPTLSFSQVFTIFALECGDSAPAGRWPEAAAVVDAWLAAPEHDPGHVLVMTPDACAVISGDSPLFDDPEPCVMFCLLVALKALLSRVDDLEAV